MRPASSTTACTWWTAPTCRPPGRPAGGRTRPPGEPADHGLGRSRGGFGSKSHLVCDANRLPLAVVVTGGQRQECTQSEAVMGAVRVKRPGRGRPRARPRAVAGDKGDSHRHIRAWLRRRGIRAVIPRRSDQRPGDRRHRLDKAADGKRAGVEQCVGWLKECRAVGTRFDKLAVNFRATAQLAMIRSYLRVLIRAEDDPSDRA